MKFGLSQKDILLINSVFSRFHEVEEVLIFGSRAKGNYKKGSDIDLAVKGKKVNDNLVSHIKGILDDELPLPYKFDVVNYATISNPDFIAHINRVGVVFYKKTKKKITKKKSIDIQLLTDVTQKSNPLKDGFRTLSERTEIIIENKSACHFQIPKG